MSRSVVGSPRRLTDKFLFRVEGPPFNRTDTGFTTVSGLESEVETVTHRQGGSLIQNKGPGVATLPRITLTRGATTNVHALLAWYQLVLDGAAQMPLRQGGASGDGAGDEVFYKAHIDVVQTRRDHVPIKRWRLYNAWPAKFTPLDGLDNNASERVIESMEIEYDYFEMVDPEAGVSINVFARTTGFSFAASKSRLSGRINIGRNISFRF